MRLSVLAFACAIPLSLSFKHRSMQIPLYERLGYRAHSFLFAVSIPLDSDGMLNMKPKKTGRFDYSVDLSVA